jgi:hypothetical protein
VPSPSLDPAVPLYRIDAENHLLLKVSHPRYPTSANRRSPAERSVNLQLLQSPVPDALLNQHPPVGGSGKQHAVRHQSPSSPGATAQAQSSQQATTTRRRAASRETGHVRVTSESLFGAVSPDGPTGAASSGGGLVSSRHPSVSPPRTLRPAAVSPLLQQRWQHISGTPERRVASPATQTQSGASISRHQQQHQQQSQVYHAQLAQHDHRHQHHVPVNTFVHSRVHWAPGLSWDNSKFNPPILGDAVNDAKHYRDEAAASAASDSLGKAYRTSPNRHLQSGLGVSAPAATRGPAGRVHSSAVPALAPSPELSQIVDIARITRRLDAYQQGQAHQRDRLGALEEVARLTRVLEPEAEARKALRSMFKVRMARALASDSFREQVAIAALRSREFPGAGSASDSLDVPPSVSSSTNVFASPLSPIIPPPYGRNSANIPAVGGGGYYHLSAATATSSRDYRSPRSVTFEITREWRRAFTDLSEVERWDRATIETAWTIDWQMWLAPLYELQLDALLGVSQLWEDQADVFARVAAKYRSFLIDVVDAAASARRLAVARASRYAAERDEVTAEQHAGRARLLHLEREAVAPSTTPRHATSLRSVRMPPSTPPTKSPQEQELALVGWRLAHRRRFRVQSKASRQLRLGRRKMTTPKRLKCPPRPYPSSNRHLKTTKGKVTAAWTSRMPPSRSPAHRKSRLHHAAGPPCRVAAEVQPTRPSAGTMMTRTATTNTAASSSGSNVTMAAMVPRLRHPTACRDVGAATAATQRSSMPSSPRKKRTGMAWNVRPAAPGLS